MIVKSPCEWGCMWLFSERDNETTRKKNHLNVEDMSSQLSKLQAEILRQAKDIERRDIQIAQSEKDITAKQTLLDFFRPWH